MLLTLLLLAPVASEWVEISQQHYFKPVAVTHRPTLISTVDQIKRKGQYEQLINNVGKISEAIARPNRVYINHTSAHNDWKHVFKVFDKHVIQSDSTKQTNKPIYELDEVTTVQFNKNGLRDKVTASRDKDPVKVIKIEDKRISSNGNKVIVLKDSKPKPNSEKPNRIYLGDEYNGSLEVLEWTDLDKLAEEHSKEFFKHNITPDYKTHLVTQHDDTATTINKSQEKHSESYHKGSQQPHKLTNTAKTERVSLKKPEIATVPVTKADKTKLSSERPVTIIQKHMVAKITKVRDSDKTKTSTEEYEIEATRDRPKISENVNNKNISSSHKINEGNIKTESSDKSSGTSMNSKPTKFKNRYENLVPVYNDKVPDPEEIMIQEILAEDEKGTDLDTAADINISSENIEDNTSEDSTNQSETKVEKSPATEKGTKAPDPDEVMIKEILNEEINKSSFKISKVPPHKGSVQRLKTSTERTSITETKNNVQDNNSVKVSDHSTEKTSSVTQPNVVNNNKKVNQIASVPNLDKDKEIQINLEKVAVLTTLKPNLEIQKKTTETDDGQYEFRDRDVGTTDGVTTGKFKPYEATTTEEIPTERDSKESYYKSKILLQEPAPYFVSKEDFFTESEELVKSDVKDVNEPFTLEPVPNYFHLTNQNTDKFSHTGDTTSVPETIDSSDKSHKTPDSPKPDDKLNNEETLKNNEKKENTLQNVVKLLKVVTDIIARNTQRSFDSKVRYLEDLKDTLLSNIQSRLEAAFPPSGRRTRSLRARASPAEARSSPAPVPRGHVDFPSSESALMTISFLTFAVFLIKLVLQVIQSYKSKSAVPTVVAAVGRAGAWHRQR